MKKCPYCAEEIQDEAIVCRYCGRDLNAEIQAPTAPVIQEAQPEKDFFKRNMAVGILVVVLIIIIGLIQSGRNDKKTLDTSTPTPKPTYSIQESVWDACTYFVYTQLDISMLKAQKFNSDAVKSLGNNTYFVKIYYPDNDVFYGCKLEGLSDGDMKLLELTRE